MPPQKRHKGRSRPFDGRDGHDTHEDVHSDPLNDVPANATVQAFEAQLVYGRSERYHELFDVPDREAGSSRARGALVRIHGEDQADDERPARDLWVDRYDILHLLPSVPSPRPQRIHNKSAADAGASSSRRRSPSPASSSSSWGSVPSDAEDTWYLSGDDEFDEYERAKKRRWMEALREERIRERDREERERVLAGSGAWAGVHEEPPPAVLTLMTHTAASLASSPNSSLLEIRILTHHATDERFSFLKGRYKAAWERIKAQARKDKAVAARAAAVAGGGLGTLMGGYGSDSDGDSDSEHGFGAGEQAPQDPPPPLPPSPREGSPPIPDSPGGAGVIAATLASGKRPEQTQAEQVHALVLQERKQRLEKWKRKRKAGDTDA